jgi:hypothetical protein
VNLAHEIRLGVSEVGVALRRPEELVVRWRDRSPAAPANRAVFPVLVASAVLGVAAYGLVMGMGGGPSEMLGHALRAPLACGAAWSIALPALYIINTVLGSRLDASTTALAALATVSFGALAMLASAPIRWFFGLTLPYPAVGLAVDLVVFAGVGVSMLDVFLRAMRALEPTRNRLFALLWLALVAVIGGELLVLLRVFAL